MAVMLIWGLSGAIGLLQPVPADFKLDPTLPPAAVGGQFPGQSEAAGERHGTLATPGAMRPRLILASGFGDDVPLEFAARQVVPASLRLEFGEMVDRQLRVSWRGGRPWQQVLRTVLAPLGLHAITSGRSVKITQ